MWNPLLSLLTCLGLGAALWAQGPKTNLIAPSPLASPAFESAGQVLEPYLLYRDATSLHVAWRLAQPGPGQATLIPGSGELQVRETESAYQHVVRFEGLHPNTPYQCLVQGFFPLSLRTLPATSDLRFAILGHTHGTEQPDKFPDTLLVSTIDAYRPHFLIHAGDCVLHSTPPDWGTHFFDLFRPIQADTPIYISPGNHDSGWPFLDGYDLRLFRELFPLAYPESVGTGPAHAYHQLRQGSIDFFFLSYVDDMGADSPQVQWLLKQLSASQAPFRMVVFGGMNDYYDRKAIWKALPPGQVDLVINGDGAPIPGCVDFGRKIPRVVVGAQSMTPSPWLAAQASEHRVTLQEILANGTPGPSFTLHTQKVRQPEAELTLLSSNQKGPKGRYRLAPAEALLSNQVRGMQVHLKNPDGASGLCLIEVAPKTRLPGFESSGANMFIGAPYAFSGRDQMLTFDLPDLRPLGSEPFEIAEIHVILLKMPDQPVVEMTHATLF